GPGFRSIDAGDIVSRPPELPHPVAEVTGVVKHEVVTGRAPKVGSVARVIVAAPRTEVKYRRVAWAAAGYREPKGAPDPDIVGMSALVAARTSQLNHLARLWNQGATIVKSVRTGIYYGGKHSRGWCEIYITKPASDTVCAPDNTY